MGGTSVTSGGSETAGGSSAGNTSAGAGGSGASSSQGGAAGSATAGANSGGSGAGGSTNGGSTSGGGGGIPSTAGAPGIIFDTDMGPDIDDAGALAILHAMADNGEANVLGVMISTSNGSGSAAIGFIDQVNTYYNRPNTPIGIWKDGYFGGGNTFTGTVYENEAFPRDLDDSQDSVPDAADLYREILASQADGSVVVVCVGFLNNLKKLLDSGPDEFSDLSGVELVAQKVAFLSDMGGAYPSGNEFNFYTQVTGGTTQAVVDTWPTPAIYSGFEIGVDINTSPTVGGTSEDSPVLAAYIAHSGGGLRSSWDLTSTLIAVRGIGDLWDLESVGSNAVEADGSNAWQAEPDAEQSYLKKKVDDAVVEELLNTLMAKAPGVVE
jgi:hypothetical protein